MCEYPGLKLPFSIYDTFDGPLAQYLTSVEVLREVYSAAKCVSLV
jgi:hypothetical protein